MKKNSSNSQIIDCLSFFSFKLLSNGVSQPALQFVGSTKRNFVLICFLIKKTYSVCVEQVSGEFKEETEYVFFIKKHMSTKFLFVDPTNLLDQQKEILYSYAF
jgi:hypothetical protein